MSNWKKVSLIFAVQLAGIATAVTPTCSGPALQVPSSCRTLTQGDHFVEEVTYTFTRSHTDSNSVPSAAATADTTPPPAANPIPAVPRPEESSIGGNSSTPNPLPAAHASDHPSATEDAALAAEHSSPTTDVHSRPVSAVSTPNHSTTSGPVPIVAAASNPVDTPTPVQESTIVESGSTTVIAVNPTGGSSGSENPSNPKIPDPKDPKEPKDPNPKNPSDPQTPQDPKDPKVPVDPNDPSTTSTPIPSMGSTSTPSSTTSKACKKRMPFVETPVYDDFEVMSIDGAQDAMDNLKSMRTQASSAAAAGSTLTPKASPTPTDSQPTSQSKEDSDTVSSPPKPVATASSSSASPSTHSSSSTSSAHDNTETSKTHKNDGSITCQMIWKDDTVESKGKEHDWMYKVMLSSDLKDKEDSFHDKFKECTKDGGELKAWTWEEAGGNYMAAFDMSKWPKGHEDCVAKSIADVASLDDDQITCVDVASMQLDKDLVTELTKKSME